MNDITFHTMTIFFLGGIAGAWIAWHLKPDKS